MFYNELPINENNIFSEDLTENNDIEEVAFKKSKKYKISRLSIKQETTIHVPLPYFQGQKALSDMLQTCSEEKEKFNLTLNIYKEHFFDVNLTFKKRSDVLINGFQHYDTTTKKNETVEFYDYYYHLENFGFEWNFPDLGFKYSITLSKDKKTILKKITMAKEKRFQIASNESKMTCF